MTRQTKSEWNTGERRQLLHSKIGRQLPTFPFVVNETMLHLIFGFNFKLNLKHVKGFQWDSKYRKILFRYMLYHSETYD